MGPTLDNAALRACQTSRDLAIYFRQQSARVSIEEITNHLLDSVQSEALSPDIFATFLVAVKSPTALVAALRQPFSFFLRQAAIKRFGKVLKTNERTAVWDAVGGVQGLLDILNDLSVAEVDLMCKVIGWSARCPLDSSGNGESTEMQLRVTELLQGLLPKLYPDCLYQTQDQRPLLHRYAHLVPACTSEYIKTMIMDDSHPFHWDQWRVRRIVRCHWPMLQQLVLQTIESETSVLTTREAAEGLAADSLMECYLPHLLTEVPQLPGHVRNFSASMSFSLEVLRRLVTGWRELDFFKDSFESRLVVPLMRRAVEGKGSRESIRDIIDLTLTYLERHTNVCRNSYFVEDSFPAYVARAWDKQPDIFEPQLVSTLKYQSYGKPKSFDAFKGILGVVKTEHRYHIFRLVILHSSGLKIDIDDDAGLTRLPLRVWPIDLFLSISSHKACELLQRLMRLKPEGDFLELPSQSTRLSLPSILRQPPSPTSNHADTRLLLTLLDVEGGDAKRHAKASVEKYKEKAFKSREQPVRAFYACSSAFYAIASGSLDLYGQIVLWLRRYLRDPLSTKTIFSGDAINTQEGIALLSGVPADLSFHSIDGVQKMVLKANKALADLLETAICATAEPSFDRSDWLGVKVLFRHVIEARIANSHRLQHSLNLKDDDVTKVLWTPTLDMLLQLEWCGLGPSYKALGFNSPRGLLVQDGLRNRVLPASSFRPVVYRFIDSLAKARDQEWFRYRLMHHPECASLSKLWPRGLPLQYLTEPPFDEITTPSAKSYTPFISSRARAAVMIEENPIMIESEMSMEERDAIGPFVDSYEVALQIDVLQRKAGTDQQSRASEILTHLLHLNDKDSGHFGGKPCLSMLEALHSWKSVFRRALPNVKIIEFEVAEKQTTQGYPVLPLTLDVRQRLEWNPDETKPAGIETREIPTTFLDCMIAAHPMLEPRSLRIPKSHSAWVKIPTIWSLEKLNLLHGELNAVKDGTLVSALLYQASQIPIKSSVLSSAFPTEQEVRYPSLFMDQEFLEATKDEEVSARQSIYRCRHRAPTTLLLLLVSDALLVISQDEEFQGRPNSIGEKTAFALLKLLSQCDRPQDARQMILRSIIDRPQSSSWHRYLLTKNYLRRLSKTQAQEFMQEFESSIHKRLSGQETLPGKRQKLTQSALELIPKHATPKPLIKVTTLKFYAKFLDDADAITNEDSIQMLSDLVQKSNHVDVQVALVESLLSKLSVCEDASPLEEQVLQRFEALVPLLGSASERQLLNDSTWQEAEETGLLPEISDDGSSRAVAPLLGTLFKAFHRGRSDELSSHKRTQILNRVILPAIMKSKENNIRWMSMFIRKYCPDIVQDTSSIALPFRPIFLASLLKSNVFQIPAWVLVDYQNYILLNLRPPQWYNDVKDRIITDTTLRESDEGHYWLSLSDMGPDAVHAARFSLANVVSKSWDPSIVPNNKGIEVAQVQKFILEQASALLQINDPDFTQWDQFIRFLFCPLGRGSKQDKAGWLTNGKPVLEHIIAFIEKMRMSADWQHSPRSTQYHYLPPTFPLCLQLLDYPQLPSSGGAVSPESSMRRFASQLLSILFEVRNLGLAHYAKAKDVVEAARRVDDGLGLAALIGDISEDRLRPEGEGRPNAGLGRGTSTRKQTDSITTTKDGDGEDEDGYEDGNVDEKDELMLRTDLADQIMEYIIELPVEDGETTAEGENEQLPPRQRVQTMLRSWTSSGIEDVRMRGVRTGRRFELDIIAS